MSNSPKYKIGQTVWIELISRHITYIGPVLINSYSFEVSYPYKCIAPIDIFYSKYINITENEIKFIQDG